MNKQEFVEALVIKLVAKVYIVGDDLPVKFMPKIYKDANKIADAYNDAVCNKYN